jgi:hypothetical protein
MTIIIDGTAGVTFPDTSVQPKSGYGPAFSAYQSVAQTIPVSIATKMQFQTKEFDTASAFDSTTNYRFQPTVAGYYQINGAANFSAGTSNTVIVFIYKNGAEAKRGTQSGAASSSG